MVSTELMERYKGIPEDAKEGAKKLELEGEELRRAEFTVEIGMLQGFIVYSLMPELERKDTEIKNLKKKLEGSIHRQDVLNLLAEFGNTSEDRAKEYLRKQGHWDGGEPFNPFSVVGYRERRG